MIFTGGNLDGRQVQGRKNPGTPSNPFLFIILFLLTATPLLADDVGDISVSAAAIYTGQTAHGYAEARVVLENNSSKTHVVTLTSPDKFNGSGNSIARITRTVTLTPGVTVVVSLLQPPLPSTGNNLIRVVVDGRDEGTTRLPNGNNHCVAYNRYGGANAAATAFVSRNLDADGLEKMLNRNRTAFSAAMAVGAPDTWSRSLTTKTWMPDTSVSGQTNWLEVSYDRPAKAYHLQIYYTQPPADTGFVELIGTSGATVLRLDLAACRTTLTPRPVAIRSADPHLAQEFSFPTTSEPIKTVRINYGTTAPNTVAIEAVALGTSGGQIYADSARASSENTAAAPSGFGARGRFGSDPEAIEFMRAESALADWSDNWLAYTPFDVVFLGADDLTAMPAPVATAIGDYLQAGGQVVIMGATSLPAAWNPRGSAVKDAAGFVDEEAGFGNGVAISGKDAARLSPAAVHRLRDLAAFSARYWSSLPHEADAANANLPVVENLKIPARSITIVMLLFIIVVGPVNILVLNRKKKRTWMLWTVPAISLLTTALIFAYSLLREGITPNARIVGLTILDQPGHHAATFGATGFYCPLTPSDGLRFDNETEATPLVPTDTYRTTGSPRDVDWTQTQHFRRGWVAARVPAQFHLRKSEVRRERLEWQKVNGAWQIINGLGAPIKSLWLADENMKFYAIENVPAGQPAVLRAESGPKTPEERGPHSLLQSVTYASRDLGADAPNYLRPGTYIAVLEGNPFIENALGTTASAKRTRSSAVVYGILDAPANP